MSEVMFVYVVYDEKRDRFRDEFVCESDSDAIAAFELFYRTQLFKPRAWARRPLGRFTLFRIAQEVNGRETALEAPVLVFRDEEVRASFEQWFQADPPHDEASWESVEA